MGGLHRILQTNRADLTSFLVALADGTARDEVLDLDDVDTWHAQWQALRPDIDLMRRTNPVRIPRNHLVQEALDAADTGDLAPLGPLLDAVTSPYDDRPGLERYARPDPAAAAYTTYCGT